MPDKAQNKAEFEQRVQDERAILKELFREMFAVTETSNNMAELDRVNNYFVTMLDEMCRRFLRHHKKHNAVPLELAIVRFQTGAAWVTLAEMMLDHNMVADGQGDVSPAEAEDGYDGLDPTLN